LIQSLRENGAWKASGNFFELHLEKQEHLCVRPKEDEPLKAYYIDQFDSSRFQFKNIVGETSVIFKDFIFDEKRHKGMIHVVVAEKNITQHAWIVIAESSRGWCIAKAAGHTVLPTQGVALAIRAVYSQAQKTVTEVSNLV